MNLDLSPWNPFNNFLNSTWTAFDNLTAAIPVMATLNMMDLQWHSGEEEMHRRLHVPHNENPTSAFLTPHAANFLVQSPLLALGTLDSEGRPWTSLWGGERGFARAISQSIIGIQATVDRTYDPVAEILFGGKADGEVIKAEGEGKMVGGLAIDLEARRRVKLYGRMAVGALAGTEEGVGEAQLAVKIEQSLGMFASDHEVVTMLIIPQETVLSI